MLIQLEFQEGGAGIEQFIVESVEFHIQNALWHIDSHMSLNRWGFSIHGAIDGYSRLITYLHCALNNRSESVAEQFITAGSHFGFPLRVRSDHGGENFLVARFMLLLRGLNRGSIITGRSTHNQRVERMWKDVFEKCICLYYFLFYFLEENGILDPNNEVHLFCLQYVYQPRINTALQAFQKSWNNHSMSSVSGHSPLQLWTLGMLYNASSSFMPVNEVFDIVNETDREEAADNNTIEVNDGDEEEEDVMLELESSINPLSPSPIWGVDHYASVLEFVVTHRD